MIGELAFLWFGLSGASQNLLSVPVADCGAGIGRISKGVFINRYAHKARKCAIVNYLVGG